MVNAGLDSLIVAGGDDFDNDAYIRAVYGKHLLEKCRRVDSLADVESEFDILAATSSSTSLNERKFRRVPVSPEEFWREIIPSGRKVALVFGREDDGLRNYEVEKCNYFINIPSNPKYPAYNLSHAVGIILYEMTKQLSAHDGQNEVMATDYSLSLLEQEVEKILELSEYSDYRSKNTMVMLRRLIGRSNLTDTEYHRIRGVLASIERKISESSASPGKTDARDSSGTGDKPGN